MILLKFSGKYKGAWIYSVAPIQQLKPIFSGTIKAFIFKLYLPVYLLIKCIIYCIIWSENSTRSYRSIFKCLHLCSHLFYDS